jgi:murein DD-endopeptidase MepM/ murein hydrolase activator NlpD
VKGYGNLVLIKHDNGYVSAYAHNGELSVKRGEKVKRGQVIAKAGQTGNVTSPQLHFEIRKGQTPVDPTAFLSN